MEESLSRRQWIRIAGMGVAGMGIPHSVQTGLSTGTPPSAPVAVARCPDYGNGLLPTLNRMMDQLGGLASLVRGKTVAVKLNLTGGPESRVGHTPVGSAQWVHQNLIGATVHLMGRAGARRIRLVESAFGSDEPLEEFLLHANWEPRDLVTAAPVVEFENTNYLGRGKKYSRLWVPGGGLMFRGFDLNQSYEDCDVFVSLAKLKEHATTGVTLSMKNCFGITPCTIYGDGADAEGPSLRARGGRAMIHTGYRQPSRSAPSENQPGVSKEGGYRVPRTVVDLVAARPIHLCIIDGIETMYGGEGPWIQGVGVVRPGVLIAGLNPVNTDAVAAALMGFDPKADRGVPPFEDCDSTLKLAERKGLGTCDLQQIEVAGTPIVQARLPFRSLRQRQRT